MLITKQSRLTGKTHTLEIDVTPEQLAAHAAGACIQDVCPQLSVADREFLISGSTQQEWDEAFPEMDDDGDDYELALDPADLDLTRDA